MRLDLKLELIQPPDPDLIGQEALRLAMTVGYDLTKQDIRLITGSVRMGFQHNFDSESAAGDAWPQLAPMTVDEREGMVGDSGMVPSFTARHPILQRTGKYKDSWVNPNNPLSLLEWREEQRLISNVGMFADVLHIDVGSKHKHVKKLSGGHWEEAAAQERIWDDDLGMFLTDETPEGRVPPRPVHPIAERFADAIGRMTDRLLDVKAARVK